MKALPSGNNCYIAIEAMAHRNVVTLSQLNCMVDLSIFPYLFVNVYQRIHHHYIISLLSHHQIPIINSIVDLVVGSDVGVGRAICLHFVL